MPTPTLSAYLITFRKGRTTRSATRFYPSADAARVDASALTQRHDGYPGHVVVSVVPGADLRAGARS